MRLITYLLIVLMTFSGCQKHKDNTKTIKIHSRDTIWARNEFDHDRFEQLQLISYGLPPDDKYDYYVTIMETEYNIGLKFSTGCVIDNGIEYYNDLMKKEIEKKYGIDFFKKVHLKVDSIYKIDKPLIDKIKKLGYYDTTNVFRYSVLNTSDERIKVINGYGWYYINKKPKVTSLFRFIIDRFSKDIIRFDTTKIEVSPLPYR
jgi:hypothetical protein